LELALSVLRNLTCLNLCITIRGKGKGRRARKRKEERRERREGDEEGGKVGCLMKYWRGEELTLRDATRTTQHFIPFLAPQ
jgi:hypothetical protein